MLELLGTLTRSRLRLWHQSGSHLAVACGDDPGWTLPTPPGDGPVTTPDGPSWVTAVPEADGLWLEIPAEGGQLIGTPRAALSAPLLERILSAEREASRLWDELTVRYAEIDLLYAISEILGHTLRLDEAGRTILRQVTRVVGARRGSILVYDEPAGALRVIAAQGFDPDHATAIPIEDPRSIAARAFREQRVIAGNAAQLMGRSEGRHPGYQGDSFLTVPIAYAAPGMPARTIGVINLTDSLDGDQFSPRDRKLVTAVANQIGAAIENARLAAHERVQQRLQDELDVAHDLQLKLLPAPDVLQQEARVAVRCLPVASVGGDFYTFLRLGAGRVGVMMGDVSSHGLSAALVMALVLAAAGIHTAAAAGPAETLRALRESLVLKLSSTEMFVSVFYGVLDRGRQVLCYANAGHPHAYRIAGDGEVERLEATTPPLGLATGAPILQRELSWAVDRDLLALWTDGLVDAADGAGERFGESRLLERLVSLRGEDPETIVATITAEVDRFSPAPDDDRTLLILRL